jgi:hypothetical protein
MSQALANEREHRIKKISKDDLKKKKEEIQNSPYKDYLKIGIKPEITKSPSNNNPKIAPLTDIVRSSSNTPLRSSNDNPAP